MEKTIEISHHAIRTIKERNLSQDLVKDILSLPGQILESYSNRKIAQKVIIESKEKFLVRVVYEESDKEIKVITVYRTTKIDRYWR